MQPVPDVVLKKNTTSIQSRALNSIEMVQSRRCRMSRPIEVIEAELRDITTWSQQADDIEDAAEKNANSLRRWRAKLIEELYDAKKEAGDAE